MTRAQQTVSLALLVSSVYTLYTIYRTQSFANRLLPTGLPRLLPPISPCQCQNPGRDTASGAALFPRIHNPGDVVGLTYMRLVAPFLDSGFIRLLSSRQAWLGCIDIQ